MDLIILVLNTYCMTHPVLIMHLQTLFKFILCHRFVPNSFGIEVTIPLVKDKTGNINDVNNYTHIVYI